AKVDFDSFTAGGGGPLVSLRDSESLKLRIGLAAERSWRKADNAGRLYGIANLIHDFKGESSVIIDGLALTTSDPKTVAELGLGASIDWQSGKRTTSLYGQINASHGLDRGDLSGLSGTAGLGITW